MITLRYSEKDNGCLWLRCAEVEWTAIVRGYAAVGGEEQRLSVVTLQWDKEDSG